MKKHINIKSGFYRFKNGFEINWDLKDWALPMSVCLTEYLFFIRILFISFIIPIK